ncbi:UDP-2,4-diacetamido-2,4,6-trideoxy-beta-L-altropyranose hydrolase [Gemmatimonadota bacterium]
MNRLKRIILIRTDSSAVIGSGHVMRCLALAQSWRDSGGDIRFLCSELPDPVRTLLHDEGIDVVDIEAVRGSREDALATRAQLEEAGAGALVLDGYRFSREYQTALRHGRIPMLVIDDNGQIGEYDADLILDQNLGADPAVYEERPAEARVLLGTEYTLLRREFRDREPARRDVAREEYRVLVTLGGGETAGLISKVLLALDSIETERIDAVVVAGGTGEFFEAVSRTAGRLRVAIDVQHHVRNMSLVMAEADIAISGGGSTCWELAFMGVPGVTIIRAENQRLIAERLHDAGILECLGPEVEIRQEDITTAVGALLSSPERRAEMSLKGHALVDGQGAMRVTEQLRGIVES